MVKLEDRREARLARRAAVACWARAAEKEREPEVRFSKEKKKASETASVSSKEVHQPTVVSDAAGAKIVKNLESLAADFENLSNQPKSFIGNVAKALGARRYGSGSQYATFETVNGRIITIRLSDHNAHTSGFDYSENDDGISIVISPKHNQGINNDGKAHVVEYYYDAIKLRRAEGKPLADIIRSIQQSLYSGEYNDLTGLAERQEVNNTTLFSRVTPEQDKEYLDAGNVIPLSERFVCPYSIHQGSSGSERSGMTQ